MNKEYSAKHTYQDNEIAKSYDEVRFTSFIGKFIDRIERETVQYLIQTIDKPAIFLDIPCGTGRFSELLLSEGFSVVGGDISNEMLEIAKEKLKSYNNISFIKADAEQLQFENNTFDGIVCMRFMGHIPPAIRINIERELQRVSKRYIIISYQNQFSLMGMVKAVTNYLKNKDGYFISPRGIKKELANIGLKLVRIEHLGLHNYTAGGRKSYIKRASQIIYTIIINYLLRFIAQTYVALISKINE